VTQGKKGHETELSFKRTGRNCFASKRGPEREINGFGSIKGVRAQQEVFFFFVGVFRSKTWGRKEHQSAVSSARKEMAGCMWGACGRGENTGKLWNGLAGEKVNEWRGATGEKKPKKLHAKGQTAPRAVTEKK